jgi:hypothetical protein
MGKRLSVDLFLCLNIPPPILFFIPSVSFVFLADSPLCVWRLCAWFQFGRQDALNPHPFNMDWRPVWTGLVAQKKSATTCNYLQLPATFGLKTTFGYSVIPFSRANPRNPIGYCHPAWVIGGFGRIKPDCPGLIIVS